MKSKILRIFLSFLTVLMVFISLPVMNASAEEKNTSDGIKYEISDGEVKITGYMGDAENLTIPSSIDGYPVTSIGERAFESCTSLTSIEISEGVTSIGNNAFFFCTSLTLITIPSSVTSIGDSAFSACGSLTTITIPESVTSIGDSAFFYCYSLTSIEIPEGVTSIGEYAFVGCSALKRMVIDKNNPVYDSRDNCNAIIKTAINTLIAGCSKTEIPSSVTSIGDAAFASCHSLTSITIPSSVTSIGYRAFSDCGSLTSITIPSSVNSIGDWAFYYCDSLSDVYYEGGEQEWNSITVGEDNELLTEANIHFNSEMPKPQTEQESEQKTESKSEAESEEKVSSGMKAIGFALIGIIVLAAVLLMLVFIIKKIRKF